jgi:hypothetical protein
MMTKETTMTMAQRREAFMASKKTNEPTPAPQDPLIAQFRRYQGVMADTAAAIPKLLREQRDLGLELGRAEISSSNIQAPKQRLETVTAGLASAARQRASASESLLAMGDELRAARAAAAGALQQIAQSTISDFGMRWDRAVAEISKLHSEAAMLTRIFGTYVQAIPPYVAGLSPDGTRMLVAFAGEVEAVTLPPQVSAITARIEQIDSGLGLCAAVAQSVELNQSHLALSRIRQGLPAQMTGVYEVTRPFHFLGANFSEGMLIDRSLMLDGMIYRYFIGRTLRPLGGPAVAVA